MKLIYTSIVLVILAILGGSYWMATLSFEKKRGEKKFLTPSTLTTKSVTSEKPAVIYGMTPATISADFEFNIEADGPILVQYPGEKPVLFTPGKGFQQMPQPKQSGPKVFTDPKDPLKGHVEFRLYPVYRKF